MRSGPVGHSRPARGEGRSRPGALMPPGPIFGGYDVTAQCAGGATRRGTSNLWTLTVRDHWRRSRDRAANQFRSAMTALCSTASSSWRQTTGTVELGVGRLPDLPHAAFADLGGDFVGAEASASLQGHQFVLSSSSMKGFGLISLSPVYPVSSSSLLRPWRLVASGPYPCPSSRLCLPLHVSLVADAHELDCPTVDGSVMQPP